MSSDMSFYFFKCVSVIILLNVFSNVTGNAYIMVPPKNTTISDGLKAKLQCQAEGYPNNITYRWYKDTVDVSTVPGLMDRAGIYAGKWVML